MSESYSTDAVAKTLGVSKKTLLRWLWSGALAEPEQRVTVGNIESRIWSAADLDRAKEFREQRYRKRS